MTSSATPFCERLCAGMTTVTPFLVMAGSSYFCAVAPLGWK
jgi:hypothetical protein